MKVLYLAPAARAPGCLTAHSFIDEEIRGFATAGVTCHVLSDTVPYEHVDAEGVRIHALPATSWSRRLATLRMIAGDAPPLPWGSATRLASMAYYARIEQAAAELVQRESIDLIHSHFGWPGGLGGALARTAAHVPVIASMRGMDVLLDPATEYGLRRDPNQDLAIRHLLRVADCTLYASDFMRRAAVALGAPANRAVTIRKGVDVDRFRPVRDRLRLRAELGVEGPMVLAVANLVKRKGVDDIIRAISMLGDRCGATLVVCGEGRERPELEGLARELGVGARVRFIGQVSRDRVGEYLAACDVFVLASTGEAAGNVVLEAMASGRPVVSSDSGGPPEYLENGVSGFVVPVRDSGALADRIGRLIADPVLADAMGAQGRVAAVERYAYGRMVADTLDFYESTVRVARTA